LADGRRHARARRIAGGVQLALPLDAPRRARASRADALGAARRRLRLDSDQPCRAPTRAAAFRTSPEKAVTSSALERITHGRRVTVAGLVVARQRPGDGERSPRSCSSRTSGARSPGRPAARLREAQADRQDRAISCWSKEGWKKRSGVVNVVVDLTPCARAAGPSPRRDQADRAAGRSRDGALRRGNWPRPRVISPRGAAEPQQLRPARALIHLQSLAASPRCGRADYEKPTVKVR